jgi:hypothetical protein
MRITCTFGFVVRVGLVMLLAGLLVGAVLTD